MSENNGEKFFVVIECEKIIVSNIYSNKGKNIFNERLIMIYYNND